jgi:hypothetical protein
MSNQPEALRLADELDCRGTSRPKWQDQLDAASELRRLHMENERLRETAEQALEALEQIKCFMFHPAKVFQWNPTIIALHAALKETE